MVEQANPAETRIVAFIDILGFRDLVQRMPQEPMIYNQIKDSLNEIVDEYQNKYKNKYSVKGYMLLPKFEQALFSDSIVISLPIIKSSIISEIRIMLAIRDLAANLMLKGIFLRGGVAIGWSYHSDNILFGEGLIKAYDLEKNVAHVPRIVVSDEIASNLNNRTQNELLKRDSDGIWYLDIYGSGRFTTPIDDGTFIPDFDMYQTIRGYICDGIKRSNSDHNIKAKYRWLANQYNFIVEENKKNFKKYFKDVNKIKLD